MPCSLSTLHAAIPDEPAPIIHTRFGVSLIAFSSSAGLRSIIWSLPFLSRKKQIDLVWLARSIALMVLYKTYGTQVRELCQPLLDPSSPALVGEVCNRTETELGEGHRAQKRKRSQYVLRHSDGSVFFREDANAWLVSSNMGKFSGRAVWEFAAPRLSYRAKRGSGGCTSA